MMHDLKIIDEKLNLLRNDFNSNSRQTILYIGINKLPGAGFCIIVWDTDDIAKKHCKRLTIYMLLCADNDVSKSFLHHLTDGII